MEKLDSKPLLPLRDIVIFPSMVVPLFVGREKSIKALQEAMKTDKAVILVAQKNSEIDEPESKDIYSFGCISKVLQLLKLPDGTVKVLVEGTERVKVNNINSSIDYLSASYTLVTNKEKSSAKIKALVKMIIDQFESYQKINKKVSIEVVTNIKTYKNK